jgi:hypothetical protein
LCDYYIPLVMKISVKYCCAVLIAITCVYSACKKSATTPSNTSNTAQISKQIAVNLYKSLSGQYGGSNINDGIKAPFNLAPGHKGPSINSVNPYCGYLIDTTYNTTTVLVDTTTGHSGHFKFTYGCTSTALDSYLLDDSLTNTVNYPLFAGTYKVTQKYFVKSLDPVYKTSSIEGYITYSAHSSFLNSSNAVIKYYNSDSQYAMHGVKVVVTSGIADITEGTTTFTSQVANLDSTTGPSGYFSGFTGTITFLGQHIAKVSILVGADTKLYTVNMLTGVVTEG